MVSPEIPQKRFYIFGSGISFSVSPTIHGTGFRCYGLPFTYDIHDSETIDDAAGLIADDRFGGASVTIPHKLQVHKFCDDQTETARLIGAINTLIVNKNGDQRTITGDNTDWSGLHAIITNHFEKTQQLPKSGLVIGAGGAARAALFALQKKVRDDFKGVLVATVVPNLQELPENPDIVIGTIPAEMTTEDQFRSLFGSRGLCIEMAYKPRQTPLLTAAQRNSGWETVTGVEVLLAQGFDQFRLWTGSEPPKEKMTEAVMAQDK